MRPLRIAFFSPFNPQKSGVSDYSEELLPALARHAEIEVIAGAHPLSNESIRRAFAVRGAAEFLRRSGQYDAAIYQVANSFDHHGYMIPCLRAVPGIVVMHDFYLHYLMLGLTLRGGDMGALRDILEPVYGARGGAMAWRILLGAADPYQVPLAWPLLALSRGVVAHNEYARALMAPYLGGKPAAVIPMGVPLREPPADLAALRRKYGFGAGDFVLASVSTLSYNKRALEALEAVAALRPRFPGLRYVMLGGGLLGGAARRFIRRNGLEQIVRHTGWVPPETYNEMLFAADAVIDLRYPSGAETSASLTRAMAAGKPLLVSAQGSFLELPDEFTFKIPVGGAGREPLCEAVARLIGSSAEGERRGRAARCFAESRHTLDQAAQAYIAFVRAVLDAPALPAAAWPVRRTGPAAAPVYAALYRLGRLGHLLRTYGLSDTVQRLRNELGRRRPGQAIEQGAAIAP